MHTIKTDKKVLIIGTGGKRPTDAFTLDINPLFEPDLIHDLNITPWPIPDNQFKQIICHHVLEHLNSISAVLEQLHRICRPDGEIYIEVPHFSSWIANFPDHKLRFSYFSIDEFLSEVYDKFAPLNHSSYKFKLLERKITFHRAFRRYFLDHLWNKFPKTYERFWTYLIPAEHLKFRIRPLK